MERKISNKHAEIIKELLVKNYQPFEIAAHMKIKFGVVIKRTNIHDIRKGVSYLDVRSDLNNSIKQTYQTQGKFDIEKISNIKWALTENYSPDEIKKVFQVPAKTVREIKMGQMPYWDIAPEFNQLIENLYPRKKKVNIDKNVVVAIKNEYVTVNGNVKLADIARKHKIDDSMVSGIISLKKYKQFGVSFNSKILSIKKKKRAEQERIKKEKNQNRINSEKQKLESAKKKLELYKEKINVSKDKINNIRKNKHLVA